MAATAPVEIGTRGTIGSLLKKEIDYFRRQEIDCCSSSIEAHARVPDMGSGRRGLWPSFRFLSITWRRRRRRRRSKSSGGIRAGICSMVEVADSLRINEIPGFSYRNLRVGSERFDHV